MLGLMGHMVSSSTCGHQPSMHQEKMLQLTLTMIFLFKMPIHSIINMPWFYIIFCRRSLLYWHRAMTARHSNSTVDFLRKKVSRLALGSQRRMNYLLDVWRCWELRHPSLEVRADCNMTCHFVEKILVGLSQGSKPKFSCFFRRITDWQGRIITARMRNWASHFRIGLGYPCGSSLQSYCRANPY